MNHFVLHFVHFAIYNTTLWINNTSTVKKESFKRVKEKAYKNCLTCLKMLIAALLK